MKRSRCVLVLAMLTAGLILVGCCSVDPAPGLVAYPEATRRDLPQVPTFVNRSGAAASMTVEPPVSATVTPARGSGPTATAWPSREMASGPQGIIVSLEDCDGKARLRCLNVGAAAQVKESSITPTLAAHSLYYLAAGTRLVPSPDGHYVAVVGANPHSVTADVIYVLDLRSGESWEVGDELQHGAEGVVGAPSGPTIHFGGWWPDSHRIVLYDWHHGEIYLVDATGGNDATRHACMCAIGGVAVTPDGQRLALGARAPADSGYGIWLSWADGSHAEWVLSSPVLCTVVAWSPDGQQLLYMRNGELWVMDRDGDNDRSLGVWQGLSYAPSVPCWSPDGETIAFAQQVRSVQEYHALKWGEWGEHSTTALIEVATGEKRTLLRDGHTVGDLYPAWSPDGEWVAFLSNRTGVQEVWLVRRDGTCLRQLTDARTWHYGLAWVAAPAEE